MCLSLWSSRWYKLENISANNNTHSLLALGAHHKTNTQGARALCMTILLTCCVTCAGFSTCFSFPICSMGRVIITPCLKLLKSCWQEVLDNEAAVFIMQILYMHRQGTVALHCSNLEHLQQFRIPHWLNSDGWLNLKHFKTQPKSQPHYKASFEMWQSGPYCFSNPRINKIPCLPLFSNSAQKKKTTTKQTKTNQLRI